MKIDNKIRDKNLQYDIHREATIMLALLSEKIVLGEKMLPSVWNQVLEETKYKHSPLGK